MGAHQPPTDVPRSQVRGVRLRLRQRPGRLRPQKRRNLSSMSMSSTQIPPSRTAIRVSRGVEASVDRLWSVISAPRYLEACHPFVESNPVISWPGEDARDTIRYFGGRVVHRRFTAWHGGLGYDLVVTDPAGAQQASVWWRIDPASDDAARLTVSLVPSYLDHFPRWVRWAPALLARLSMKRYLRSVVAGVAYYTETGERVRRNQFGSHRWFSPPT